MCKLSDFEEFTAYLSGGIHDVHHQGLRNDYYAKVGDTKTIIYNDQSTLENMHCAVAFTVMKQGDQYDVFKGIEKVKVVDARKNMIYWVLGTDNAHHAAHCKEFVAETANPEFSMEKSK